MGDFQMPSLGADMVEGTLLEWLVTPGQQVHRGDTVAVVDTDKAAIEVECFEDGVVQELLVPPGTRVPVGTALARIGAAAAPVAAAPAVASPLVRRRARAAAAAVKASPLARRQASRLGFDVATIAGTGPGGAVTAADVAAAAKGSGSPPPETPVGDRVAAMRRAIGDLMTRSKREIPHYYVSTSIDLSTALTWMRAENAARGVSDRLVPAALMLKAAALAARAVPAVNGRWVDGHLQHDDHVHLGVAVSLRSSGLVAPAILDADTMELDALMHALTDLVTRARSGRLRRQEMTEGTITVTNLGDNGAEAVFGVIFPPQVALVGLGRVVERPWAYDGMLGVRPTVTATVSGDHRASDGHDASRYLATLADLLQAPEKL